MLDFASGSGRNGDALRRAGLAVVAISDASASNLPLPEVPDGFAAAISTHGLLHGTPSDVRSRLDWIARRLEAGALLYATFGSTRDARFGEGTRIDEFTFAPVEGDERGVAHAYFTRAQVLALLEPEFEIESLDEERVDAVAGAWAHRERPLSRAFHWFAVAQKR